MDFAAELQRIYDSETNIEIGWFWDCGIRRCRSIKGLRPLPARCCRRRDLRAGCRDSGATASE
jgi:hypothetical protein